MRPLVAVAAMLVGSAAAAQDPGRPVVPGTGPTQLAQAYIRNNTWRPVRFVVSSANGTTTGVLAAGFYGRFAFGNDGKPRVLSAFELRRGGIVNVREIEVHPNHVYTVTYPSVAPLPPGVAAPPGVAREAPGRDRGQPVKPSELRNVIQLK